MPKKVIFITEYLNPPFDEGIKKTALHIFNILNDNYLLLAYSRYTFNHPSLKKLSSNKLFLSKKFIKEIKIFKPDVLIYLPFQSSTFASYIRHFILRIISPKSKIIFYTLQPKPLSGLKKLFIRFIKPNNGITASPKVKLFWDELNVDSILIPLFTNLNNFKPIANIADKYKLRAKYGLPKEATIIAHIGHLNEGRNLESLIPLNKDNIQVVIVGSSSTPSDAIGPSSLKQKLVNSGIIILDHYIKDIQEIYQLSDLYIFPIIDNCGSIGMPLSILEARACGIPVLTTDYGSVKHFLNNDGNSIFYSNPVDFLNKISKISLNKDYSNSKVSELNTLFKKTILDAIEN